MISYEPLWQTMKEKGVSTYKLREVCGIDSKTVRRLKANDNIESTTASAAENNSDTVQYTKYSDIQIFDKNRTLLRNFTLGAGFRMSVFSLDAAYLISTAQSNPLDQTLRFSLSFDLDGLKELFGRGQCYNDEIAISEQDYQDIKAI